MARFAAAFHGGLLSVRSIAIVALCGPTLIGCMGAPSPPEIDDGAFTQWPITAESEAREYVLVLEAGSPGYSFVLDRTQEAHRRTDVFVTVVQPDPAFVFPQVVVKQRLLVPITSSTAINVYAREQPLQDADPEAPYRLALQVRPPGTDSASTPPR